MLLQINKAWGWNNIHAVEVVSINNFGNIIIKENKGAYWRICPEELSCEMIASSESELKTLFMDEDFKVDWEMYKFVQEAKKITGELDLNESYCLKLPAVIGGKYEAQNFGKINLEELIAFSGNMAYQIRDLKDGDRIELEIE